MSQEDRSRWTDSDSGAPELADAVRALRERQGSAAQLESLANRLSAQLAAPAVLGSAGSGATNALALVRKVGLVIVGIAVIGALAYWSLTRNVERSVVDAPTVSARPSAARGVESPTSAAPGLEPPSLPSAVESEDVVSAPQPKAERSARHDARGAADASVARRSNKPVDAEGELSLLGRAQQALDRDPSIALALAAQHAREYPRGVFAEEREVLALEAELKMKRAVAARARAERFMSLYPRSTHARRVRTLLETSGKPIAAHRTNNPNAAPTPSP